MRLGQAARVVSLSNPLAVHFSGLVRETEKPSTADKFAWHLAVLRRLVEVLTNATDLRLSGGVLRVRHSTQSALAHKVVCRYST